MKAPEIFHRLKAILLLGLMLITPILNTTAVFAKVKLPSGREDEWMENNILFYDPDGSAKPSSNPNNCVPTAVSGSKITLIGDSLSESALSEFDAEFPGIDHATRTYDGTEYLLVRYSKHFKMNSAGNHGGITIAEKLKEQGELRPTLIFALGTNDSGSVTDSVIDELVSTVGTGTTIVLTTNANDGQGGPDYASNNAAIRAAPSRHPNIIVADWEKAIADSVSSYINDPSLHVHLSDAGKKLFVKTIKDALGLGSNGSDSDDDSNSDDSSIGANTNYAGATVFSQAEIDAINANRPFYEAAAQKYGFSWKLLAVIHNAEYSLRRSNPSNGQGVYQLYSYTAAGTNSNAFLPPGPIDDAEFQRQTDIAASIIAGNINAYHIDINTTDGVKKLLFSYNGMASVYIEKAKKMGFTDEQAKNGEGSAYVMNRYDARRDPTSDDMDPNWAGRFTADGHYTIGSKGELSKGFGTYVQYLALGGISDSSYYCPPGTSGGGGGNGSIVDTALMLSWEGLRSHSKSDPKPEYVTAMKETGNYKDPCGKNGICPPKGASCDQFVSTVMRYSGLDPSFPTFSGGGTQRDYLINSDKYTKVDFNGDMSKLQPGDILVTAPSYSYHILLFLGDLKGDGRNWQASASWNDRTGEHFQGVSSPDSGGRQYYAFRYTGGGGSAE